MSPATPPTTSGATSGNPGGRPRGSSMRKVLGRVMRHKHNGKNYYELLGEALAREVLNQGQAPVREGTARPLEGPKSPVMPPWTFEPTSTPWAWCSTNC